MRLVRLQSPDPSVLMISGSASSVRTGGRRVGLKLKAHAMSDRIAIGVDIKFGLGE
jgi:hypothetical protein